MTLTLQDVITAFDLDIGETMSDEITVTGTTEKRFAPHEAGQFVGQVVDVIDLGEKVEDFPGSPAKLAHKCVLVFRTGEKNADTGDFIDVSKEYTVSMHEKSTLRQHLEAWRGKTYSDDEIKKQGVPLHKLTGQYALLTIAQATSKAGRPYATIKAIVGVPKQMKAGLEDYVEGYTRADYWETRKTEYLEAARKFKGEAHGNGGDPDDERYPGPQDDDDSDDLPFS